MFVCGRLSVWKSRFQLLIKPIHLVLRLQGKNLIFFYSRFETYAYTPLNTYLPWFFPLFCDALRHRHLALAAPLVSHQSLPDQRCSARYNLVVVVRSLLPRSGEAINIFVISIAWHVALFLSWFTSYTESPEARCRGRQGNSAAQDSDLHSHNH